MTIIAKLIQLLPLQTGAGKNGQWKKQDIIVETEGQFPKNVCVSIWGEKIDNNQLQIGNHLRIDFDLESREYNERWYTDVKALKIEVLTEVTGTTSSHPTQSMSSVDHDDIELPF